MENTINNQKNNQIAQVTKSVNASREGRQTESAPIMVNENLTLREILSMINTTTDGRKPGHKMLSAVGDMIAVYSSDDYRMTVYDCGFAVIKSGKRRTIVRMSDRKDYTYNLLKCCPIEEDDTPHYFDEEYFLDKPWTLWVMIKAEDQLEANNNKRESVWISKHSEIPDDKVYMNGGYNSFENRVADRDEWERALKMLTDRQRQVLQLRKEGYTQEEIGRMIGISRETVCQHLKYAFEKIRKYYSR